MRDNLGFALRPADSTLAGLLRPSGFATGGFVSAYVMRGETGLGQGFEVYDDRLPASSPEVAVGEVQRDGADTLAAAERWLDTTGSSRFFLFLHLYEPHTPYTPPARYGRYEPYDGEIAYSDELVGRLVASLKRRSLYDSALIVLLSDHGEGLGDHGEREHGIFLYSAWRDSKRRDVATTAAWANSCRCSASIRKRRRRLFSFPTEPGSTTGSSSTSASST